MDILVAPESELKRDERLCRSIAAYYRDLEWLRDLTRQVVKQFAGPTYGGPKNNQPQTKYLNLLRQAVDGYMVLLVANNPKVLVTTHYPDLKPFAMHFQVGLNTLIEEINLRETLESWVMGGIFGMGVIRTHMADSGQLRWEGDIAMDPGIPFASFISTDNWVHDSTARKYGECKLAGNMYPISYRELREGMDHGWYDPEVGTRVVPKSKSYDDDPERLERFSRGDETDDDEYEPCLDLADIWIPAEQRIKTFVVESRRHFQITNCRPLAIEDWEGPETGPYHVLGFVPVPENVVPASPAADLSPLDDLVNNAVRKFARQLKRLKENLVYESSAKDGAKGLTTGSDGQSIKVDNLQGIGLFRQGGVKQDLAQAIVQLDNMFNQMAGNIRALLGLGAESETVGQEQLIHRAGSRKVGRMQAKVLQGTKEIVTSLASLMWHDQFRESPGEIPIPGERRGVASPWRPGDREGTIDKYSFDIGIYSMMERLPAERAQTIINLIPVLAQAEQSGFNTDALVGIFADLFDEPALKEIKPNRGGWVDQRPKPDAARKPPVTSRNYTRRSIPSQQGALSQLPGLNRPLPDEPAGLVRPQMSL